MDSTTFALQIQDGFYLLNASAHTANHGNRFLFGFFKQGHHAALSQHNHVIFGAGVVNGLHQNFIMFGFVPFFKQGVIGAGRRNSD